MFRNNNIDDEDRNEIKQEVKDLKDEGEGHIKTGDNDLAAACYRQAADKLEAFAEKEHDDDLEQYWDRMAKKYRRRGDNLDPETAVDVQTGGEEPNAATDGGAVAATDSTASQPEIGQRLDTDTTFDDLGGLDSQEQYLGERVVKPLECPEPFEANDIGVADGVIFHGPPGTGKTSLAEALANRVADVLDSDVSCILLKESDITEGVLGASSDNMAMAFERARSEAPSVLIFEEIDAIAPARDEDDMNHGYRSIVNELLAQVNEIRDENVFCVGTTNLLSNIDTALRTTHRFDTVHVGMPDLEARAAIFRQYLSERQVRMEDFDCEELARMTEGFTGSNIEKVTENAARRVSTEYAKGERDDYMVPKAEVLKEITELEVE